MNSTIKSHSKTAEDIYVRQHMTISQAIEKLQATLDLMQLPDESAAPITWGDVSEFAHIASAANTLIETLE